MFGINDIGSTITNWLWPVFYFLPQNVEETGLNQSEDLEICEEAAEKEISMNQNRNGGNQSGHPHENMPSSSQLPGNSTGYYFNHSSNRHAAEKEISMNQNRNGGNQRGHPHENMPSSSQLPGNSTGYYSNQSSNRLSKMVTKLLYPTASCELDTKYALLKKDLADMTSKLKMAQDKIGNLESMLDSYRTTKKKMLDKFYSAEDRVLEMTRELESCESKNQTLLKELEMYKTDYKLRKNGNETAQLQITNQESQIRRLTRELKSSEFKNQNLLEELERNKNYYFSSKNVDATGQTQIATLESQREDLCRNCTAEHELNKRSLSDTQMKNLNEVTLLEKKNKELADKVTILEGETRNLSWQLSNKCNEIKSLHDHFELQMKTTQEEIVKYQTQIIENLKKGEVFQHNTFDEFSKEKNELTLRYEKRVVEMESHMKNSLERMIQMREENANERKNLHSIYAEQIEKLKMDHNRELEMKDEEIKIAYKKALDAQKESTCRVQKMMAAMKDEIDQVKEMYQEAARGAGLSVSRQLQSMYESFNRALQRQQEEVIMARQRGRFWNNEFSRRAGEGAVNEEDDEESSGVIIEEVTDSDLF